MLSCILERQLSRTFPHIHLQGPSVKCGMWLLRNHRSTNVKLFISVLQDDAIVNSVIGSDFDLSTGMLSSRLSDKAGSELQDACKQHGTIEEGEVVETDSYNLPCKRIIHCHLASYSQQRNNEKV